MSTPGGLVYGVGALRAAARGDRMMWSLHRAALRNGIVPVVDVGAVAEAVRTEVRHDLLDALLDGVEVEQMDRARARRIGELAARVPSSDLNAVAVAEQGVRRQCAVVDGRNSVAKGAAQLLGHDLVQYLV